MWVKLQWNGLAVQGLAGHYYSKPTKRHFYRQLLFFSATFSLPEDEKEVIRDRKVKKLEIPRKSLDTEQRAQIVK